MPSPFPGMDPWLELSGVFPDLHNSLITYLREAINAALPAGYVATTSNRVWIDTVLRREPDVSVFGADSPPTNGYHATEHFAEAGMVAVAIDPVSEPWEEPYLEIVSNDGDRLVTAIEVLSLSNKKPGDSGRSSYLQKQNEFRRGGVNLVEIDLLRSGTHTTVVSLERLRKLVPTYDYHICVTAVGDPNHCQVKGFRMMDRLPAIHVPLDPGIRPVIVELQPILDRVYDTGKYRRLAKYDRKTPEPALTPEQQQWADNILKGSS